MLVTTKVIFFECQAYQSLVWKAAPVQTETPATGTTDGGGEKVFQLLGVASQAEITGNVINKQKVVVAPGLGAVHVVAG